jgi:hypothetical protein
MGRAGGAVGQAAGDRLHADPPPDWSGSVSPTPRSAGRHGDQPRLKNGDEGAEFGHIFLV